ncbi:MAG TPA: hypothetical protein VM032_13805 [Vicinamibacterales bacterium]|nr:hypothetical protein [Vicinamibacterales bacterium]
MIAVVGGWSNPALAQGVGSGASVRSTPVLDLSTGYGMTHDSGTKQMLPVGWFMGAGLLLKNDLYVAGNNDLSVVGEVSGSYKNTQVGIQQLEYRTHGFLGGLRMRRTVNARVAPFGQLLGGAACYCGTTQHPAGPATAFAWQLGGGADVRLAPMIGLRVQGDFRDVRGSDESYHQYRISTGVVLQLWPRS